MRIFISVSSQSLHLADQRAVKLPSYAISPITCITVETGAFVLYTRGWLFALVRFGRVFFIIRDATVLIVFPCSLALFNLRVRHKIILEMVEFIDIFNSWWQK